MIEVLLRRTLPDAERRGCPDCAHMKAAVSWWCTSDDAIEYRGTSFPGVHSCQFWEPCKTLVGMTRWQRFKFRLTHDQNYHIDTSENSKKEAP